MKRLVDVTFYLTMIIWCRELKMVLKICPEIL